MENIDEINLLYPNKTDPILIRFKDQIKEFAYISSRVTDYQNTGHSVADTCYSDRSKLLQTKIDDPKILCEIAVQAVTPSSYLDNALQIKTYNSTSALGPTEQFYTARGSQSIAVTEEIIEQIGYDWSNYKDTMLIENINTGFNSTFYQERVLFSTVEMPDYANYHDDIPILVSFPQWLKMTDMSLN